MNTVRWGLLSTAHINRRVIPAIRQSPRGQLAAVASRDLENARAYADRWEIPQAFGSYEAMLESGAVDAVYISLPNHLHAEWSIRALRAGVNVLCEKPFAVTLDEVDRMIAASRETGKALAEAFMYLHHPQTRIIGEWVRSGRLGAVRQMRGVFNYTMSQRDGNVRLYPPEQGGGSLWDVGVYPLSMAQFVFGEPPQCVYGSQWIGPSGVDENFAGLLEYSGGRTAQITSSFRTPLLTHVEILGEAGSLTATRPFTDVNEGQLIFTPVEGEPQVLPVPEEHLYLGEVEDLQAAILDGRPTALSLEATRNHVRTVLALYEAARRGAVVRLE